jgi:hypothetical protein
MKNQDKLPVDLNFKELLIIGICVGSSFLFTLIFNVIL